MPTSFAPRLEMLQVAEAVAREKMIEHEEVLDAMEQAFSRAARAKYGVDYNIRAIIDRKTGMVDLSRVRQVVEAVEDENLEVSLAEARNHSDSIEIGEDLVQPLPPMDLGRIAAQTAKQVIVQQVRAAERAHQYEEYKDRVGEIVSGLVKRVDFGNITVDLGQADAVLRRDEQIPREILRVGDRVRAYIYSVREELRGPQIFLSRTHPIFMAKLFAQEVPEIYEGVIEIKSVARDPGSRAKISVISHDSSLDPVGACIGMRGSRVQAVVKELQGEKIDIIPWTENPTAFISQALQPAAVSRIYVDEAAGRVEVVVPEEQLSLAIGRRGQNVRLASNLSGWEIDITTEAEESERRQKEFAERSKHFEEALDIDAMTAGLVVTEGYHDIYALGEAEAGELAAADGLSLEYAKELIAKAQELVTEQEAAARARWEALGVTEELVEFADFSADMLVAFGEAEVRTIDDLADLATDELMEILEAFDLAQESAEELIMAARADWFASEEDEAEDEGESEGEAESEGEDEGEEALLAADLPSEAAPDSTAEAGPAEDSVDLSGGADAETRS